MPVSAEGRVEHQKQNQTATSQWPVGFVFGVQLDYSCRLKSVPSNGRNRVCGEFVCKSIFAGTRITWFLPSDDTLFDRRE